MKIKYASDFELHPGQQRIIASDARYRVVAAGRRFGKTALAMEWLLLMPGGAIDGRPVAFFAPTYKLLLDVWSHMERTLKPVITRANATERRIELISGGSIDCWTLEDVDAGRGRKYARVVIDEAAHARYLREAWEQAIGPTLTDYRGEAMFISTPAGINYFYELFRRGNDPTFPDWASFQMPSHANPHIPADELERVRREVPPLVYQQEYLAEFVTKQAGALWDYAWFEREGFRLQQPRSYTRIAVGVDPNVSNNENSDEMGIIVRGLTHDGHIDCLADYTTRGTIEQRASAVVRAFHQWRADRIVVEVNNGGDWIPAVISGVDKHAGAACKSVHATRGKLTRAEPDAALCERGKTHHVGYFPELEAELTNWMPGMPSPNRLDAYVWAGWELMETPGLNDDEQRRFAMM